MKFVSLRFSEYNFSSLVLLHCQRALKVPWRSHFRNKNISLLPTSLDSTPTEFLSSLLYTRIISLISPLFIYLYRNVHQHFFVSWEKEGSQLIDRGRGCPFREAYIRPLILVCLFIFSPFPSLLDQINLKTLKDKESSVGMRFPQWT